ncbi:hypothetical protein HYW53_03535 [Candidatus Giovannonibacteria bacterium]|nr:hypothetical protein [Candidatus Giovannonibacteria bacterium]
MVKNKEVFVLSILLVLALIIGGGFLIFYKAQSNMGEKSNEEGGKIEQDSEISENEAKDYFSNLKFTFTNETVPSYSYQTSPRLKKYIGKVQNLGDEIVTSLTFKVMYLNKDKNPIWEENLSVYGTLKKNYIKEFEFGGPQIASEWSGTVTYELTGLQFENSEKVQIRYEKTDRRPPLLLYPIF